MTETTTIQVRKDQAKKLKEIQGPSGNYKTAIDTVLEGHMKWKDTDTETPEKVEVDLSEVLGRIDDLENTLPRKIADELR